MKGPIRVIDVGGNGVRRADVVGTEVYNMASTGKGQIINPQQLVEFATGEVADACLGIVYAMAGYMEGGLVIKSPNAPWLNGFNLVGWTETKSGKKTLGVNDMDGAVAGMAELYQPEIDFAGITWSSGIGKRVWKDGKILITKAESGHTPLDLSPFAPLCGCGARGCVESICGGEALRRRVIAETEILGIEIPPGMHPCQFLDQSFQAEEEWAINIYDMVARGIGTYLSILQLNFCLKLIIWKGTFAKNALPLLESRIRGYMHYCLKMEPAWVDDLFFRFSPEPDKDALIGAAALFRQAFP